MPHTPIRTRESITWRIPIDLLARVDELRKRTNQERTAVVVEAIQEYLGRRERAMGEAEGEMQNARRIARKRRGR